MKYFVPLLIVAGATISLPTEASQELAKKSNCITCHQVDKKLVGPAYRDIAKKYAGIKDAEKTLAAKIKAGGKGVWGEIPMPPNPAVKEADIGLLAKWILAGAK